METPGIPRSVPNESRTKRENLWPRLGGRKGAGAEDKCADPRPPTTPPLPRVHARRFPPTRLAHHLPTINV